MLDTVGEFVFLADASRDARDWPTARDNYAQALERDAGLEGIWVQYGHALKECGDHAAAERAYARALVINAGNADTHLQMGHLLKITGRLPEAREAYRRAAQLDPGLADARIELMMLESGGHPSPLDTLTSATRTVRNLILGTIGQCNASCIHCPTGKPETGHVPKVPMPMEFFRELIGTLARNNYRVEGQVSFGLFGDGLIDPMVVERARLLRELMPEVRLSINTNGAAYNRAKHRDLVELTSVLALHVESLNPAVYTALMQPLRPERVFPKFDEILEDFGSKVAVSVPVSRLNRAELPAIREHFMQRGAGYVNFDRLSGRCSSDRSIYDALALNPTPGRCNSTALNDLIIDCDGLVLMCCNDFRRIEPVGSLATQSVIELMFSEERRAMVRRLDNEEWDALKSCAICVADGFLEGVHS